MAKTVRFHEVESGAPKVRNGEGPWRTMQPSSSFEWTPGSTYITFTSGSNSFTIVHGVDTVKIKRLEGSEADFAGTAEELYDLLNDIANFKEADSAPGGGAVAWDDITDKPTISGTNTGDQDISGKANLTDVRTTQSVADYTAALSAATGSQKKEIVTPKQRYWYDGSTGVLAKQSSEIKGGFNIQSGLQRWRQALGMTGKTSTGTGLGGLDVVCFGDSILEGYNGTDVSFDSAIHYLKVKLQERFNPSGVIGGYGFIPVKHGLNYGTFNSVLNLIGSFSSGFNPSDAGYGGYDMKGTGMSVAAIGGGGNKGFYIRFDPTLNPFKRMAVDAVQFAGWRFGGYGTARWDVGIGVAPTVGAGSLSGTHVQSASNLGGGYRFGAGTTPSFTDKISLTASNDNYVQVVGDAGNTLICAWDGVFAYNGDFTCGVRLHDMNFYGKKISEQLPFIRDTNVYSGSTGTFVKFGQGLLTGGSCNAKLYIFNWITNDCGTGSAPATSLANFTTQYGQAIDYALGLASKPSVLLVIPPQRGDSGLAARTTAGEKWSDFRNAIYNLATARSNVAILDLSEVFDGEAINMTSGQIKDAGWVTSDDVHLSDTGQRAAGDLMYKVLTT